MGMAHNGQPIGYSEHQYNSGLPGEDFPIEIPHSLTFAPFDPNVPVFIWSSETSTVEPSIFKIPATASPNSTVIIEDISIAGGERGVHVEGPPTGTTNVLLKKVNFNLNEVGLQVNATPGSDISISVRNCKLTDTVLTLDPLMQFPKPPNYRGQAAGLSFVSSQAFGTSPGEINGEVYNLRLAGIFASTNPSKPTDDLFGDSGFTGLPISRIIEVITSGHSKELGGVASIAQVNLDIESSVLDGKASENPGPSGWDVGIFASALHPDGTTEFNDYSSGYRITIPGTEIKDCRLRGIHCASDPDTRGELWLQGGSVVSRIGIDTPSAGFGEGVRMHCNEGYLALHTQNATIIDNLLHGIHAKTDGSNQNADNQTPVGLFFDLQSTSIHQNGGDGIRGISDIGVLGGTWVFKDTTGLSDLYFSNIGPMFQVEHGQGVINGCDISNNGGYGIYFWVSGSQTVGLLGAASVRIANTIVWNHPLEGILVDMQNGPFCFVPIVHSTFAGNGDLASTPQTIEFKNSNGSPAFYRIETKAGVSAQLNTKIYNSIFQRKNTNQPDFGSNLDAYTTDDFNNVRNPLQIACAGIRAMKPNGNNHYLFTESTGDPAPFFNPILWETIIPSQFFLFAPVTLGFNHCPTFLHVNESESSYDFNGDPRPFGADHWKRDKGANHADDS